MNFTKEAVDLLGDKLAAQVKQCELFSSIIAPDFIVGFQCIRSDNGTPDFEYEDEAIPEVDLIVAIHKDGSALMLKKPR